jgi:peptide/nickel transport system ATP-binding protein/oligopeptide transport system ATP-binding protein
MPLLEVKDLCTYFETDSGVARAVDGVSFQIEAGETLGIVGESGCGKTVTALSILGLIPSPPGEIVPGSSIRFGDEELLEVKPSRLRQIRGNEISMIFQEPMTSLNPVFTVGHQIEEVLKLHRGLGKREARAAAVALLGEVGIPEPGHRLGSYPHQMSGGMLQRVMIAIALSCEPRLLIADEPTTALDVTIQAQILDLLVDLQKKRGMALLLITHDLGVIAEVCDRVVVMYGGQIVEMGTTEDVLRRPEHPYTRGLLASLPGTADRDVRLNPIPGTVPSPVDWPVGCRFEDRCSQAEERCARSAPKLLPVEAASGRSARCWLVHPDASADAHPAQHQDHPPGEPT